MEQREFNPGDLLLKEGDQSDVVYEIVTGEVEVFTEPEGQLVTLGAVKSGEFLGEMGIIEHRPRSASARAKTQVSAVILEKWEFMRLMSQNPSSAYRLIHRLSERLRALNSRLAEVETSHHPHGLEEAGEPLQQQGATGGEELNLRITILPASEHATSYVPKEGILVEKFPFSIGRMPKQNEPKPAVPINLSLPDTSPFRLSRQHFSLAHDLNGYAVFDLGSTLGTEVNGEFLGENFGHDFTYLKMGDNKVTAGGVESPFTFTIRLEKP